ncbi:hypothetical protein [Bradyrhizobium sp. ARR65]|uniref:hypothetical protein n=1 Tax=Bradyrhizobium sp. ARR65 TaxID=1040989 RepID=UPI000466998A|nr:hypothetical protein [Bradyrhizobium sp. ARR65]
MFAAILLVTATLVLLMVQKCLILLDGCGDRGKAAPVQPGSSLNQVKGEPEGRHELWRAIARVASFQEHVSVHNSHYQKRVVAGGLVVAKMASS